VYVGLDPSDFSDFTAFLNLGGTGALWLSALTALFAPGIPMVIPKSDRIEWKSCLSLVRKSPIGSYEVVGVIDGRTRFVSYRKMMDYPL